jgi:TP901 family phage tail tape measure protein
MSAATANLGVRIVLQDSASAGLSNLTQHMAGLGVQIHNLSSMWGRMTGLQKTLGITAAAAGVSFGIFARALGYVVEQGSNLEAEFARVSIAVHGADQSQQALQDTMIRLGNQGLFSIQQLADGFVAMGTNGQTATDIINYTGDAMVQLAEATSSDTVPAAELLSSTLQQFNLDASQADYVSKVLFVDFYNGQGSISNIEEALRATAGTARLLKIPVQDLSVVLDMLGQAGLKGEQGGTSLNYMLRQIADPTKKASEALQSLGLTVQSFYGPDGSFIGMKGALDTLGTALKGLPTDQKIQKIQDIFNIRSSKAAGALLSDIQNLDSKWPQLMSDIQNANVGESAKKQTDTLKGALTQLKTSFQDFAGLIGLNLTDTIKHFIQGLNSLLLRLSELPAPVLKNIGHLLAWGTTISGIVSSVSGFGFALSLLSGHFRSIGGIAEVVTGFFSGLTRIPLLGFANPLNVLRIALGGVRGTLSGLATAGGGVRAFFGLFHNLSGPLKNTSTGLLFAQVAFHWFIKGILGGQAPIARFIDLLRSLTFPVDLFRDLGPLLKGGLVAGFKSLLSSGSSLLPVLLSIGGTLLEFIGPILLVVGAIVLIVLLFTRFRKEGAALGQVLGRAFGPMVSFIKGFVLDTIHQLVAQWKKTEPVIQTAIDNLVKAFKNAEPALRAVGKVIATVVGVIIGIVRGLVGAFIAVLPMIIGVFSTIINVFSDAVGFIDALIHGKWSQAFGFLWKFAKDAFGLVMQVLTTVISFIVGFVGNIIDWFKHLWETLIGHSIFTDTIMGILNLIKMLIAMGRVLWNLFVSAAIGIFNLFKAAIYVVFTAIMGIIQVWLAYMGVVVNIIKAIFITPFILAITAIWTVARVIFDLVTGKWGDLKRALLDGWNFIKGLVIDPVINAFHNLGQKIQDVLNNVKQAFYNFRDTFKQVWDDISSKFGAAWDGMHKILVSSINKIIDGIDWVILQADKIHVNIPGIGDVGINIPEIPHLAKGTITNGPEVALIGDNPGGQEVVAPVSQIIQAAQMALLGMHNSGINNQPINIVLQVDSRQVASAFFDSTARPLRSNGFSRRFR